MKNDLTNSREILPRQPDTYNVLPARIPWLYGLKLLKKMYYNLKMGELTKYQSWVYAITGGAFGEQITLRVTWDMILFIEFQTKV